MKRKRKSCALVVEGQVSKGIGHWYNLQANKNWLNELSLEIICHVMDYLPFFDVMKLDGQCKKLREAVTLHLRIRKSIDFTENQIYGWMSHKITDKTLINLLKRCRDLQFIHGFHPPVLCKRRSRKSETLSIPGIVEALAQCTQLQGMAISNIFLLEAIVTYLPLVEILGTFKNRSGSFPVEDVNRIVLPENPKITSLHLIGITLPELPPLVHLKHLQLRWVHLSDSHPFKDFSAPLLQSFVMAHCAGPVNSNALKYVRLITSLAAARNLRRLELIRVPFLGGLFQHVVEDSWRIDGFRQLTSLKFGACKHALEMDVGFLAITSNAKLEELSLQPSLTRDSLFVALKLADVSFPFLQTLNLGFVDAFPEPGQWTNEELLAEHLSDIVEFPATLTDTGMKSVAQCFMGLQNLEIYNCPHIHNPTSWFTPGENSWGKLKELYLRRCHAIKLEDFCQFIQQLPCLELLHLEQMFKESPKGCSQVGLSAGTGLGMSSALVPQENQGPPGQNAPNSDIDDESANEDDDNNNDNNVANQAIDNNNDEAVGDQNHQNSNNEISTNQEQDNNFSQEQISSSVTTKGSDKMEVDDVDSDIENSRKYSDEDIDEILMKNNEENNDDLADENFMLSDNEEDIYSAESDSGEKDDSCQGIVDHREKTKTDLLIAKDVVNSQKGNVLDKDHLMITDTEKGAGKSDQQSLTQVSPQGEVISDSCSRAEEECVENDFTNASQEHSVAEKEIQKITESKSRLKEGENSTNQDSLSLSTSCRKNCGKSMAEPQSCVIETSLKISHPISDENDLETDCEMSNIPKDISFVKESKLEEIQKSELKSCSSEEKSRNQNLNKQSESFTNSSEPLKNAATHSSHDISSDNLKLKSHSSSSDGVSDDLISQSSKVSADFNPQASHMCDNNSVTHCDQEIEHSSVNSCNAVVESSDLNMENVICDHSSNSCDNQHQDSSTVISDQLTCTRMVENVKQESLFVNHDQLESEMESEKQDDRRSNGLKTLDADNVSLQRKKEGLSEINKSCENMDTEAENVSLQRKKEGLNETNKPCENMVTEAETISKETTNSCLAKTNSLNADKTMNLNCERFEERHITSVENKEAKDLSDNKTDCFNSQTFKCDERNECDKKKIGVHGTSTVNMDLKTLGDKINSEDSSLSCKETEGGCTSGDNSLGVQDTGASNKSDRVCWDASMSDDCNSSSYTNKSEQSSSVKEGINGDQRTFDEMPNVGPACGSFGNSSNTGTRSCDEGEKSIESDNDDCDMETICVVEIKENPHDIVITEKRVQKTPRETKVREFEIAGEIILQEPSGEIITGPKYGTLTAKVSDVIYCLGDEDDSDDDSKTGFTNKNEKVDEKEKIVHKLTQKMNGQDIKIIYSENEPPQQVWEGKITRKIGVNKSCNIIRVTIKQRECDPSVSFCSGENYIMSDNSGKSSSSDNIPQKFNKDTGEFKPSDDKDGMTMGTSCAPEPSVSTSQETVVHSDQNIETPGSSADSGSSKSITCYKSKGKSLCGKKKGLMKKGRVKLDDQGETTVLRSQYLSEEHQEHSAASEPMKQTEDTSCISMTASSEVGSNPVKTDFNSESGTTVAGNENPQKCDQSTSTIDPFVEEDHIQVLELKSESLLCVTLHLVGVTDLVFKDCPKLSSISGNGCRVLKNVKTESIPRLQKVTFTQCKKLQEEILLKSIASRSAQKNCIVTLRPLHQFSASDLERSLFSSADADFNICIIYDYCTRPQDTLYNRTRISTWTNLFTGINGELLQYYNFPEWNGSDAKEFPWGRNIYTLTGVNDDGSSLEIVTDVPWLKPLSECPDMSPDKVSEQDRKVGVYCPAAKGHFGVHECLLDLQDEIALQQSRGLQLFAFTLVVYINMCDVRGTPTPDPYI